MKAEVQKLFAQVYQNVLLEKEVGKVASYIPELAKVSSAKFGAALHHLDGSQCGIGDYQEKFSIQSIAKVLALTFAFEHKGDEIWQRMDVEPSGDPFNSLVQLEYENGIPRNPLINAGAIVVSDILLSCLKNPKEEFLAFVQKVAGDDTIQYSSRIATSEKETGFRNYALANMMKSFDNIKHPVEEVLDFYFHLCSIEMSCVSLSRTFLYLANDGLDPISHEQITSISKSKRINAIMQLCGFYDEAGEFAFRVGLPGKSGVGGGIIAIYPDKYAISVWSPALNAKGNSYKGMRFLEAFTSATGASIF